MIGKTMLFNPFTGAPRHPDDIKSDPAGVLVWDGEEPLHAAAAPSQAEPTDADRRNALVSIGKAAVIAGWRDGELADFVAARLFSQAGSCQASGATAAEADDGSWRAGMVSSEGYEPPRDLCTRNPAPNASVPLVPTSITRTVQVGAPPAGRTLTEWPSSRDVKRPEDMGDAQLRVLFDSDNDVIVELWAPGQRSIAAEFCNAMNGGGRSPNTRMALIALMVAMEADAASSTTAGGGK